MQSKYEYGYYFDSKTGKPTSPEFTQGESTNVEFSSMVMMV